MYDDVAKLVDYVTTGSDRYGNRITTKEETEVYVQPRGVYSSEFYNASQLGHKPSVTFIMANREDYDEQPIIEYHGQEYSIIRVDWDAQRDEIQLVCEKRVKA
ncbi:MAG: phage head closure protein [Mogibacterium sp.]|nr:phage head closure protein [Mogibacterium sp.]